ncbi:efflux RND transporter periplasmic adaptor subunit [Rhizobium sp. RAF56]|jgi:HlyD family secretion protein|uniref:efflux RND transporter periplasmic adaptor subunit n=1 Tax=Rhizobium sp. RAF56 TaxID=3233062 RepID=UPI003F981AE7
MAMKPHKFLSATALLLALAAPIASAAETVVGEPKQNLPAIVVTQAVKRTLVDRVVATGTMKAVEEVYIQPQVEGLSIRTLNADVGDKVKADSTLATLNEDALVLQRSQMEATQAKAEATLAQLQAQLLETQANAEQAEQQRARAEAMVSRGTTSTSQLEQSNALAAVTRARVASAKQAIVVAEGDLKVVAAQIADIDLKLTRTGVKTPVDGTVAARNARVGAIAAGNNEPLFTIIRDSDIELVTDVSENDITRIEPGQKATISLSGSREKLTGAVRLVSPTVDPVTRLGAVHISIDDDAKARAGMYGTAEIVVRSSEAIALPLSAVNSDEGGASARKVEGDVVKFVKVETGIQDGAYVEIVGGLKAGDEVVAKAGAYVRDGDRITPVRDAATN